MTNTIYFLLLYVAWSGGLQPDIIETVRHSQLPDGVTNNAVAAVERSGELYVISYMGLMQGRTYKDITRNAYQLTMGKNSWQQIPGVPGNSGRLAGTAIGVGNYAYVFGGYTVEADHSEKSIPDVHRYDPETKEYFTLKPMPVAVDDAVSVSYKDRYIYLISGWHDTDNVDLVQVYDLKDNRWFSATPYPGAPVFGHAGGIVGNTIVIADGVKKVMREDGRYKFTMSDENYAGTIHPDNPALIKWQKIPRHPGPALYRMASTGSQRLNAVVFAGGSDNPYNYNGIGYNGHPAEPSTRVFGWNLDAKAWIDFGNLDIATMDHRGLIVVDRDFYIIGGMRKKQQVSRDVLSFRLPSIN